ncbi:MAG: phenylalanine--tRNA ligase subunit beta, partial [Gluconacetobacter diazotrophicus]|nr:phenylalanine--tRNA ligase subunit beta [Gluconacetobacter diazotrophicus]
SEVVSAGAEPDWRRDAVLRFERLRSLGGAAVPADEAVAALEHLGFVLRERNGEAARFAVPSWRNDVAMPVTLATRPGAARSGTAEGDPALSDAVRAAEPEADLVEEVLRLRGLDTVPAVPLPPVGAVPAPALTPRQARTAAARRVLAGRGLNECVGFSFTGRENAERFGGAPDALRLLNPIAADLDQLRPTPLATLAEAAARNAARGQGELALFELGAAFGNDGQLLMVAGLRTGRGVRHPGRAAEAASWRAAKADAVAVLTALGVPGEAVSVTADAPAHYHPGRSGTFRQGPKLVLGWFGALHPRAAAAVGIDGPVCAFELVLDRIPDPKRRRKAAPELPSLQAVRRDFAFVVKREVTAEALLRAARGADRALISGVSLFDVYEGDKVPDGTRSLAIEVVFQPTERSLTDAELEAASVKVVAAVFKATGGTLRG